MKYWKHNVVNMLEKTVDRPRIYTTRNVMRLRRLAKRARHGRKGGDGDVELNDLLESGSVVAPTSVSCDIVTMNSEISLRESSSNDSLIMTVVFPPVEDLHEGKVSVLSPLGCAVLGHRVGDEIEYRTRLGKKRVTIDRILYQPEAMGHYRA